MALVTDEIQQQQLAKQKMQDDDLENIYVTFLAICFIRDTLISCGDDGFLYLWDKERIVKRVQGHEGSIFALSCNQKLGLVVSGGVEGIVTLWRLLVEQKSNVKTLERLKVFNMRKNLDSAQAAIQPEFNIQSVFLGYNRIVVGMRSGSIQEVAISDDSKMYKASDANSMNVKSWLRATDHEVPKSVGIDMVSSRIFTITQQGLFTVWELNTLDIIYQKHYHKITKKL